MLLKKTGFSVRSIPMSLPLLVTKYSICFPYMLFLRYIYIYVYQRTFLLVQKKSLIFYFVVINLEIQKSHSKGVVPKEAIQGLECLRRGGNKEIGWATMKLEALPGSNTRGGGVGMVTAVSQLLWPRQRAFKQVSMFSFEKMQVLIILLKYVMLVIPVQSFQQLIRQRMCQWSDSPVCISSSKHQQTWSLVSNSTSKLSRSIDPGEDKLSPLKSRLIAGDSRHHFRNHKVASWPMR